MAQPTIVVKDANGDERIINTINTNGQATMANSQPVAFASDQSDIPIDQHVTESTVNSSNTNLSSENSYTFTGTQDSTLGVGAIQVSLYADKECLVRVQQSPDGTNWDLSDLFICPASSNFGQTIQAISSYFRVIVTTKSETTTVFRLQSVLCPIVEVLPRTLDVNGSLKVSLQKDQFGNPIENSPNGEMQTVEKIRLCGAVFDGSTIDPNFWNTSVSTGTVTQSGCEIVLTSGTANGHYARLYTVRRARFVSGSSNKMRCHLRLADTGTANVKRRWGVTWGATMPTITDGAYFELDGTTFSVVTLKGGSETRVSSGTFNGHLGYTYTPTTSNTVFEILLTNGSVSFIVGGVLLHKVTASSTSWANTLSFYAWADVSNGGNSSAVAMTLRSLNISRIGALKTSPRYYRISGNAATHILKYGAGVLHKLIFNNTSGTSITIYDNTAGSGTVIGIISTASAALGSWDMNIPFQDGLTLVTVGNGLDMTVLYE